MILVIFDIFNRADGGFDDFAADAYRWITHVVGQVFLVWALLLYVLWQISQVNVKCKRLPAMFSTLNFGIEIDHDRSVVVNHIIASDVGFTLQNVPVTGELVFKLLYFVFAIAFSN